MNKNKHFYPHFENRKSEGIGGTDGNLYFTNREQEDGEELGLELLIIAIDTLKCILFYSQIHDNRYNIM